MSNPLPLWAILQPMWPIPIIPRVDPVTSIPIRLSGIWVVFGSTAIWWPVAKQDQKKILQPCFYQSLYCCCYIIHYSQLCTGYEGCFQHLIINSWIDFHIYLLSSHLLLCLLVVFQLKNRLKQNRRQNEESLVNGLKSEQA